MPTERGEKEGAREKAKGVGVGEKEMHTQLNECQVTINQLLKQ
jgi:hypothetical protein